MDQHVERKGEYVQLLTLSLDSASFLMQIYLFLWFWFVLVACITILELFNWLWITLLPSCRYNFVSRHVTANRLLKTDKNVTEAHLKNFALNRLRHDGVLILRLVADNAGEMVTTEIIDSLWDRIVGRSGTNGAFSPRNIAQFHEIDENTAARHSDSIESAGNSSPPGYTLATSRDRIFEAAN